MVSPGTYDLSPGLSIDLLIWISSAILFTDIALDLSTQFGCGRTWGRRATGAAFSHQQCRPRWRCWRRSWPEAEIVCLACKAFRSAHGGIITPVENFHPNVNRRSGVEVRLSPATIADHTELGDIRARCSIYSIVTCRRVCLVTCRKNVTISAGANCSGKL